MLTLLELILEGRIRAAVEDEIGEKQQGLRQGRGTTDGDLCPEVASGEETEGREDVAIGFTDLEKADDTIPREMATATLRWLGVPEIRLVEGT